MKQINKLRILVILLVVTLVGAFPAYSEASHTWGNYHWARTTNSFDLKLGDNVSGQWDSYLATTSADWSQSTALDTTVVAGQTNPKNCRATAGRVEVCSSRYGNNGWLGVASIWASANHITQATVKVNDSYFNTAHYNTPAWRNLVMCQEVGHTFGLDHQDENFTNPNLGTCMDYTNNPETNQHPNAHDYEMLEQIYAHLDSFTTVQQTITNSRQTPNELEPGQWGEVIRSSANGRSSLFRKSFGNNQTIFTFVIWAD